MCKTATIEKYAHERNDRAVTKVFAQARHDGIASLELEEMGKSRDLSNNRASSPLLRSMKVSTADGNAEDVMQEKQSNLKNRASSLRPRSQSPSNPTQRVSFSESDERKDEEPVLRPLRKVPKRRSSRVGKETSAAIASSPKHAEEQSPKGLLSSLGKRLSGRFSDKSRSGDKKKGFVKVPDCAEEEEMGVVEEDPVMSIFESRNTQRVRWSIEGLENEGSEKRDEGAPEKNAGTNVTSFMSRALFGSPKPSKKLDEEMKREVAALDGSLVWESADTPTGPEVIHTNTNEKRKGAEIMVSFTEDEKARAKVVKLLSKARRAEHVHFRYDYAVKCYVKSLEILTKAKYPDAHPTVQKVVQLLTNAHHVQNSYNNSANIVKMGIKYEDAGELVRALKMYTIAYRIRRDNLNRDHPSLVVLLNMLGSIQIKRGELREAMQIFELGLKDSPVIFNASEEEEEDIQPASGNLLAKSVTYREMGTIYERWGNLNEALNSFHKSLECVAEWKEAVHKDDSSLTKTAFVSATTSLTCSLENIQLTPSSGDGTERDFGKEQGEMEVFLGREAGSPASTPNTTNMYETFFPPSLEEDLERQSSNSTSSKSSRDSFADMDLALTLHQIAQLRRCQGQYTKALDAYEVALRGMKYALGKHHPNVAAVLGNIGNLQKEMGEMDAAYRTYQEVLGIESYRLGLSHPDVAITLHNIATIDAARGNYDEALNLYRKVLGLQKKLYGEDHLSVSVTAACMGDVYERIGELKNAMESFEEAVRIKSATLGRHSLDVSRLFHKLGKLSFLRGDYHMAESFTARALFIYRLNKLEDDHEWVIEAFKDTADIDGAILQSNDMQFEC
jgi:tetratricopeptide (TPR) repeat protein